MSTEYWPKGKPLPFDEKKLKRLLQTPKIKKEKKKVIRTSSIDHVHFYVSDLDRTLQYYSELFGFKVYEGSLDEGFMIIGNKGIKLCLMENPKIEHFHSGGFCHFGFHVRDYDEVKKLLQQSNVHFTESEWEHSRSLYFKDLDGYTIELSAVKGGGLRYSLKEHIHSELE